MATKIVTKNSSTASAAPSTSDLVQGELAVNVTDKRLYTENNAGAIVELGTNPLGAVTMASTLAVAGVLTGTSLDISGDIDIDGTTNLDVLDVDGAVNFAADVTFADGADIITASAGTSNFRAGVNAGNSIVSGGNYNTVVGDEAGTAITTGTLNTCLGGLTGDALTVGTNNTALGMAALGSDTKGNKSTAVGVAALFSQNFTSATDTHNTAVGYNAGTSITTGALNTAVGALSLENNTTGGNNAAFGRYSLNANTTGYENTALGEAAGYTTTTGYQNIMIGRASSSTSATASGQCTLGSSAITDLRCNDTSISSLSDARDKTDVIDSPYGLDFINTTQPRQFKWDTREGNAKDGRTRVGFIAQELLTACDGNNAILDLVLDDNPDKLEAKYGNLLPIAVQAIKDLSAQVDALTARLTTLEG